MTRERESSPTPRHTDLWLGVFFVALALPLMAHDVTWLAHHVGSLWAIRTAVAALWRAVAAVVLTPGGPLVSPAHGLLRLLGAGSL